MNMTFTSSWISLEFAIMTILIVCILGFLLEFSIVINEPVDEIIGICGSFTHA